MEKNVQNLIAVIAWIISLAAGCAVRMWMDAVCSAKSIHELNLRNFIYFFYSTELTCYECAQH